MKLKQKKNISLRKPVYLSPRHSASWISRSLSLWVFSVLYEKPKFTLEATYDVNKLLETNYLEEIFEKCWTKELLRSLDKVIAPKLFKAIWCRFGTGFTIITLYLVAIQLLCLFQVYLLYCMVKMPDIYYSISLVVSFMMYNFLKFNWNKTVKNMGIQLRVGLQGLLLKKLLLVDTNKTSGEELNKKALTLFKRFFIINDVIYCTPYLSVFVVYTSSLSFILCYTHSNHLPTILITSLVLCVLIPLKGLFYIRIQSTIKRNKKAALKVSEIFEEFFKHLAQVKVYCLEKEFIQKIMANRKTNAGQHTSNIIYDTMLTFVSLNFVTLMSFLYFSCHGQIWISPSDKNVLPAIAAFQLFVYPISVYSSKSIMALVQFFKAVSSLQVLLMMMDRCEQSHCPKRRKETETSLKICGVSLKSQKTNLFVNLNLGIGTSKLICFSKFDILTKGNLLRLLLKEVDPFEGTVEIYGKISLCSNKPWLFPRATVKKNIICSLPFNFQRFQQVLNICELGTEYVKNLIGNKVTIGECGEENITKELAVRLSIARVLYNDSDILVFDRPLEGVTLKKSMRIIQHLVDNLNLYRKTIIAFSDETFVTSKAHRIFNVVMGGFEEKPFQQNDTSDSDDMVDDTDTDELYSFRSRNFNYNKCSSHSLIKILSALIRVNINEKSLVQKYKYQVLMICSILSGIVMEVLSPMWILSALNGNIFINWDNGGLVDLILPIIVSSLMFCFSTKLLSAEFLKMLYTKAVFDLFNLPFWSKEKRINILTTLENYCTEVEEHFFITFVMFSHFLMSSLILIIILFITSPLVGLALIITSSAVYYSLKSSTPYIVQLLDLNHQLLEILQQHYCAKESQVLSLRSLGASDAYMQQMSKYFDRHTSIQYLIEVIEEALTFWLCIISTVNIGGILLINHITGDRSNPISLYCALVLPALFPFLVKFNFKMFIIMSKIQTYFNCLNWEVKNDKENDAGLSMDSKCLENDKIYIISPEIEAYFPISATSGEIIAVTGIESTETIYEFLGLSLLTSEKNLNQGKYCFVPCEPHIFRGSLKSTLNPNNQINECDLWSALAKTGMLQEVIQFPSGLLTESQSWSEVFTVYQRQLLFLSIQIALQNKVVVIHTDRKTISYSEEADIVEKAQKYLNKSTVFIFSNRSRIVSKCDKMLVFKNGVCLVIEEFGEPNK